MLKRFLSSLHAPVYRKRLEVLVDLISPHLRNNDSILDVGCGSGQLAAELVTNADKRGMKIEVLGLERFPRGSEPIPVAHYAGGPFPFPNKKFDLVILADVLHHEQNPSMLLEECVRVAKRLVVIKDHQLSGPLAKARVSLIDWAANAPYGVKCLYRYNTPKQWDTILRDWALTPVFVCPTINLYPVGFNLLFGRRLQYIAICRVANAAG
jgi:ubiquinone/menaquinone biosynthesis C-methylase UbiE